MSKLIQRLKIPLIVISACYHNNDCYAQKDQDHEKQRIVYLGVGTGIDYGGIGFKGEVTPLPYLGIFAGAGYNFDGLGVNGGISLKALPFKAVAPTLQVMYGYNAVLIVQGAPAYNKTYYGLSAGAGIDWTVGKHKNKLFAAIYYPFRSKEFYDDMDKLKRNTTIDFKNKPLPITFSFGFNFRL